MEQIKTYNEKFYFNDFEISVVEEPYLGTLSLFGDSTSNIQKEQYDIFKTLEKNAPFVNAASFKNQVSSRHNMISP